MGLGWGTYPKIAELYVQIGILTHCEKPEESPIKTSNHWDDPPSMGMVDEYNGAIWSRYL